MQQGTPSTVSLLLHAYMGMIEYNTIYKGTRTLGTEAGDVTRFDKVLNNIATICNTMQNAYAAHRDKRRLLWRAVPYILHYLYKKHDLPYITIEKHFPIGVAYDDLPKPILKELWSEKICHDIYNYTEANNTTWGHYFTFTAQDRGWMPRPEAKLNGVPLNSVAAFMVDVSSAQLADIFPENVDQTKLKHFQRALDECYETQCGLIGLMCGHIFKPEMFSATEMILPNCTVSLYNQLYRSDVWQKYPQLVIDYGFRALYKLVDIPYKVSELVLEGAEYANRSSEIS